MPHRGCECLDSSLLFLPRQASCLQEEETASRVEHLASLEKSHKHELLRLRTESDSLTNKSVEIFSAVVLEEACGPALSYMYKEPGSGYETSLGLGVRLAWVWA